MTLEELVPSRATCERMKAAEWDAPTLFRWQQTVGSVWLVQANPPAIISGATLPAPTFAEIAERLPEAVSFRKLPACWVAHENMDLDETVADKSITEAAALLWLALNAKEPDHAGT